MASLRHKRLMRIANGARHWRETINKHGFRVREWPAVPTAQDIIQQNMAMAMGREAERRYLDSQGLNRLGR